MKFAFALLLAAVLLPAQTPSLLGFVPSKTEPQRRWEERMRQIPNSAGMQRVLQTMAAQPHHAGSPGSKRVAEYALGLFRGWGLQAEIEPFDVLLPYPATRLLEVASPNGFKAKLSEPAMAGEPDASPASQLAPYNAYSADGDVTAPLVYVNYGLPEDYAELDRLGISVRGKIVIARYGRSWRGIKPKVAQERGAVGCLIYSDPKEDGYFAGDVYPKGRYRPADGVQRGSVMDMPVQVGDPTTPGWASVPGAKRIRREESKILLKIPVLPISYGDAQPLLQTLGGAVAPEAWRGALPITYHVGPGTVSVHLKLTFDWAVRPIYNVIATLPGSDTPDQWIIYGNHHDAWVYGASDPLSGATALLETARTLAELGKQGWKPRRTVKFALWDSEEFGLIGSTEWAEKHADELREKAVAYFNTDTNSRGALSVDGSATLAGFMAETMRDSQDPLTSKSLLVETGKPFSLAGLGAGSDYVAFVHHLGIPGLNMGFSGGGGGVYHSAYDSLAWFQRFSDGDFVYGKALAQVMGTNLMRLANADLLPYDYTALVRAVQTYMAEIQKQAGNDAAQLQWSALQTEVSQLEAAAKQFDQARAKADSVPAPALATANRLLVQVERGLLSEQGLPNRPWYRNQISAPGLYTGYGVKTLPGIREAVEGKRWTEANQQAEAVAQALRQVRTRLEAVVQTMEGGQ